MRQTTIASDYTADLKSPPPLAMVVTLPPPANGMNLVSQAMVDKIRHAAPVVLTGVTDTKQRTSITWRLLKHSKFYCGLLKGAFTMRRQGRCYFVPDSNQGLYLNILEAPLLRLGYSEVWLHHHVFSYVRKHDWRMRLFLKIIGKKAQHIVLGQAMEDGLRKQYNAEKIICMGNAPFVRNTPEKNERTSLKAIGFLGNITPEKGICLFLETIKKVQAAAPEIQALIAGPISDPKIRNEVEGFCADAPNQRRWLGPVFNKEKEAFFREIDVLLFPSTYINEALPVTIYEALAAGVPVLAIPRGCIPEQLGNLDSCFKETEFVQLSTEKLLSWVSHPGRFQTASLAARDSFLKQKQSHEATLDTLVAYLTSSPFIRKQRSSRTKHYDP